MSRDERIQIGAADPAVIDDDGEVEDLSGSDMDVWGGEGTHPSYTPRPRSQDFCIVKVDGQCTCVPGFERCEEFAAMNQRINRETREIRESS